MGPVQRWEPRIDHTAKQGDSRENIRSTGTATLPPLHPSHAAHETTHRLTIDTSELPLSRHRVNMNLGTTLSHIELPTDADGPARRTPSEREAYRLAERRQSHAHPAGIRDSGLARFRSTGRRKGRSAGPNIDSGLAREIRKARQGARYTGEFQRRIARRARPDEVSSAGPDANAATS